MKWISIGDYKFGPEEIAAINQVIESNRVTEHRRVVKFENSFSKYIGTKASVLTNSGTSALILGFESLKACGRVEPKTKVITTPLTYVATINALRISGFSPIFVDIDPREFIITPDNIQKKLEETEDIEQYSIILPVHLMGFPADMDEINKIGKRYELISFEDSAQAHGSRYKGKICGSLSTLSAFSFYVAHNIQVGEMGALATSDLSLARLARRIKANGRMCDCQLCTRSMGTCPYAKDEEVDPRFTHTHIGYNFKTTEFMASIGLVQLSRVESIIKQRQQNIKFLNDGLEQFSEFLQTPIYSDKISYMAYPLVLKDISKLSRNKLTAELEKNGVETRPLFSCVPTQQPSYSYLRKQYAGKLPVAEYTGKNGFYIGCHQYLSEDDLNYVIDVFKKLLSN